MIVGGSRPKLAKISATATGWVMYSSPDFRSWPSWAPRATSKARETSSPLTTAWFSLRALITGAIKVSTKNLTYDLYALVGCEVHDHLQQLLKKQQRTSRKQELRYVRQLAWQVLASQALSHVAEQVRKEQ